MEGHRLLGFLLYSWRQREERGEVLDPRPWAPALLPAPKAQTLSSPCCYRSTQALEIWAKLLL